MRLGTTILAMASTASALATNNCRRAAAANTFENLVSFGDSYTDDGRLAYYVAHKANGPPAGVLPPQSSVTSSGGLTWAQLVQRGVPGLGLYDYASSGAVCSNEIVSRYLSSINNSYPSVIDNEVPWFKADLAAGNLTLYKNRTAENTVYSLWIGTNDLGSGGFLTEKQVAGANLTTYVECIWSVFDAIYATGGRRFVLLNVAPLHLAPLYRPSSQGGEKKSVTNETEYASKMMEYSTSVNTMFDYGVPFHALVKKRWSGSTVTIFNTHQLLTDIYNNPSAYLTAPANSTGWYHHCAGSVCTNVANTTLDNFMFYDDLHPSTKTDSIIAENFIKVVNGTSKYGTTYKS
ncbi:hypothetical protein SEPCBS57363_002448 [Sporothrix epigloea]|uniref:Carbohydrate esterase family 16 protein n=1 Tax=Sporothrix epigloea TaxID=1892477 RepID=A0ABP0DH79_9PEZI